MFASKVAKPQAKAAEGSTSRLRPHRPTLLRHRLSHDPTRNGRNSGEKQESVGEKTPLEAALGGVSWDFSKIPVFPRELASRGQQAAVQPKFAIGAIDDPLEREADAVADHVMGMAEPSPSVSTAPLRISRKCATCDEDKQALQTKPARAPNAAIQVPPIVHETLRSPGQPLDPTTREFFESRFGYDFSDVQIHTSPSAAESAERIGALAYTAGSQVVFGSGKYAPDSTASQHLLAHELTHVVQQTGATPMPCVVQRAPDKPKAEKAPFRDCTEATTLNSNPRRDLIKVLDLAQRFVNGAIGKLEIDPETEPKGSSYRVALERHFLNPSKAQRMGILGNFKAIYEKLKPGNVRCAANDQELATCAQNPDGEIAAFMRDGEFVLCFNFWVMSPLCKATTLIHEPAHAVGIGSGKTHPPYRRGAEYPFGATLPSKDQTAAIRSDNPDAYAYFAAHVWRDIDMECIPPLAEVIDVRSTKDALPVTREKKDQERK
jgi:hypothetical protein